MFFICVILCLGCNFDVGFLEGDDNYGYVVVVLLDKDGYFDFEFWWVYWVQCMVDCFFFDDVEKVDGWLIYCGSYWFFYYDEEYEGLDEFVFCFGDYLMWVGEYFIIYEVDGDDLIYKIIEVQKVQVQKVWVKSVLFKCKMFLVKD